MTDLRGESSMIFDPHSIRLLRNKLGVSQNQLARSLNCTSTTVANWEQGRAIPSGVHVYRVFRLCQNSGISTPEIFKKINSKVSAT